MSARIPLVVVALVLAAPHGNSQAVIAEWAGAAEYDEFGSSVAAAGDVDGDGFADVIAGSPYADPTGPQSGSARVFSGRTGAVIHAFVGERPGDLFGHSVAGGGDLDGDGVPDLLVGAVWAGQSVLGEGAAYCYSGASGQLLRSWSSGSAYVHAGWAVDFVGDLDHDGLDDVAVGMPYGGNGGLIAVYPGSPASASPLFLCSSPVQGAGLGRAVAGVGDSNGDGTADILGGAPATAAVVGQPGAANLYSGADGSLLITWLGKKDLGRFGSSVAAAGDINGDGVGDVIVGAPKDSFFGTSSGSATVFSPASGGQIRLFKGASAMDQFGTSVGGAGDVDGDGTPDLVIGAPYETTGWMNEGFVHVISGATGNTISNIVGHALDGRFGYAVAGVGDVNSDGGPEIASGAPLEYAGAYYVGTVRIFGGWGPVVAAGEACGELETSWWGSPAVGQSGFTVTLDGAPPFAPSLLVLGLSGTSWQGLPLPFALDPFGAPGCWLAVSVDTSLLTLADATGFAQIILAVPSDAQLVGGTLYSQWAVLNPAANPLGIQTAASLAVTIQP